MGKRDKYVPEDFIEALARNIKGYKGMNKVHQQRMAYYIWDSNAWYRKHKFKLWEEDHYMTISYRELEKDFGRGGFNRINDNLKLFDVTPNWHKDKNLTRGYKLSGEVAAVKEKYLKPRDRAVTRLIDANAQALRSLPVSVAAKDSEEVTATAWKNAKPLNNIPVDIRTLKTLHAHLTRLMGADIDDMFAHAAHQDYQLVAEEVGKLLRLANTNVAGKGYIMHRYYEAKTGRLYAKGTSLQTVPRIVRQSAMHGLYEFDFENCHYAIFDQMAASYGYESDAIRYYLTHKKGVRTQLAEELGLSIPDIKTCLLAVMYGARTNTWHENAIPKTINNPAKTRALYAHPLFKGITDDIKQGRRIILDNCPKRRTTILNAIGKSVKRKEKPEVILAHLLQGIEARALERVVEILPDDVLLLLHDGFVTRDNIEVSFMEREVYQATGYRLSLSGGVITLPADLEFTKTRKVV